MLSLCSLNNINIKKQVACKGWMNFECVTIASKTLFIKMIFLQTYNQWYHFVDVTRNLSFLLPSFYVLRQFLLFVTFKFSIKFKRNFFVGFLIILNRTYDCYTEVKYSLYVPSKGQPRNHPRYSSVKFIARKKATFELES